MAREDFYTVKKSVPGLVHRFKLEKYSGPKSRHTCPNCDTKHSYSLFIDIETGDTLDSKFGKCSRIEKCGYFNNPYGEDLGGKQMMVTTNKVLAQYETELNSDISLIAHETFMCSLTYQDNFSKFLVEKFGIEKAYKAISKYFIGESSKWKGSTVFWQIDYEFDVRTGKIILYDDSGSRVKKPFPKISWAHVPLKDLTKIPDYNLKQCTFGEHLITEDQNIYHIVESEKTAVICDIFSKEEGVWLAIGGIEMIDPERLKCLEGKSLIFYPDKGDKAYFKWKNKLEPLMKEWDIKINRAIEKTDLELGEDMADYILKNLK